MTPPTDMLRRHAAHLAELAELGMSLARDLHAEAAAAETPELKAELSQAFHRVARTVRQSMALEARLAREDRREAMEAAARSVTRRKAEVRARVRGMVWNEAEASDCAALIEDLDDRLSDAEHLPDFSADLDTHIARLRGELAWSPPSPPPAAANPPRPPAARSRSRSPSSTPPRTWNSPPDGPAPAKHPATGSPELPQRGSILPPKPSP